MVPSYTYTLADKATGNIVFKLTKLEDTPGLDVLQRLNCYAMLLITDGNGSVTSDVAAYTFTNDFLLCFAPYQPFLLKTENCSGFIIYFHPDFFCIHKHHKEVACNGVLFNNIYQPPLHKLTSEDTKKLLNVIADMREELQQEALAQHELLVSWLKIFLITASRSKVVLIDPGVVPIENDEPFILQKLKDAIEQHYREKHTASEYATILNISVKALAKITKSHFNRTLTNMIAERIIIEAKRELYLTGKPVKAIAYELGFNDEYHFSRFFKNKATISPQLYRNKVGAARGAA